MGRFRLVERLGAGGMGEVFVAFDPQLERQVALKLLKLSRWGDEPESQRLLREANAMAKISHPNVVSVFDAGLDGPRPWVAMELIRGTTMREWLAKKRSWPETLEVLCQVARGLEAAHRAGLVHRDIKPENVLMGSEGRVAVTDFGIAQAAWAPPMIELATPATPDAVRQRAETRGVVMGTPGYMAPEQYLRQSTDERTDQYAFAITAYEALYGLLPFETDTKDLGGTAVQVVRAAPRAPTDARGVPAPVWRALERALQPRADDRFPSIAELRTALEQSLPTKRSLWPVAIAVAVPLALAVAYAGTPKDANPCAHADARLAGVWDAAKQQKIGEAFDASKLAYAGESWRAAKGSVDAYAQGWQTMYGEACRATRSEGRQSEQLLDLRMSCLERARGVLSALTDVWSQPLTPEAVQAAPSAAAGLPSLSACADVRALTEKIPAPKDPGELAKVNAARAKVAALAALNLADKRTDAKAAALDARQAADATRWDEVRAEAALEQGKALAALEVNEAEPAYLDAARLAGAAHDDRLAAESLVELTHHLAEDKQNADRALLVANLADGVLLRAGNDARLRVLLTRYRGDALLTQSKYAEAKTEFTSAYQLGMRELGDKDWDTVANLGELQRVAELQGDYAEARKLGDQVVAAAIAKFGPNNPTVASRLNNLAMAVESGGDHEASIAYYRRAIEIKEKSIGHQTASTATSLNNLSIPLLELGKLDEAQKVAEDALAIRQKVLGPQHPYVASTLGNLGDIYRIRGEMKKSIELEEQALAIKTAAYGAVHANVANSLAQLGQSWQSAGDEQKAYEYFQRSLEVRKKLLGPENRSTLHSVNLVAGSLIAQGKCAEAMPMVEANLAATEKLDGGRSSELAHAMMLSAECALSKGDAAKAEPLLEHALKIREDTHGSGLAIALVYWGLGRAEWTLGKKTEAVAAVKSAEREMDGDATAAKTLTAIRGWLKAHQS